MFSLRQFVDFTFLGRHRLETVSLIPLGCRVDEAIAAYGRPLETKPLEDSPEIGQYTFSVGPYHEATAMEWQGTIQSITYWSAKGDPSRDLAYMLNYYKDGSRWHVFEEGYWYQRDDDKVKLWCSAMPAIGVGYVSFLSAKAKLKTKHNLKKLAKLSDVTWTPDDAIVELQRLFVEDQNPALMEFARRSDKIAVSPDGCYVFIIRNHHRYETEDGFGEYNGPPEVANGPSTQVINHFQRRDEARGWGKSVLPHDANVESIRFDGDTCHVTIRNLTTHQVFNFSGPAPSIVALAAGCPGPPYNNDELWREIEDDVSRVT